VKRFLSLPMFASWFVLGVGCASEPPPPPAEAPPPPPVRHAPKLHMQSELGQIDESQTEATWKRLQPAIMQCYEDGQKRLEYLGGDVKFFLRVGQDGAAKYAYLVDGTLGDRTTERCMLDLVLGASWPRPDGGEAEVQKSMGFDPPSNVRAPSEWGYDQVAAALGAHGADVAKCKAGVSGTFRATAYVQPAGTAGKVAAAGLAVPSKDAEGAVDCLIGVVKKMKMPSPGSYAAKVSFTL